MKKIFTLLIAMALLMLTGLSNVQAVTADPITTIGNPNTSVCGVIDVPVTVENFNNIGAISLKLNYDANALSYTGVTLNTAIANTASVYGNAGVFTLGNFGSGIVLADDAVLFTLQFTILPAGSGSTSLTWSTVAEDCEYAGPNGTPVYSSTFNNLALWTIPEWPVKNTDTGLGYCNIPDAVYASETLNGHTITVADGTYVLASTLNISKQLTIIGATEAGVIIDASGNGTGYGIKVEADNVTLEKFTLLPPVVPASLGTSSGGGFAIHASFNHDSPYSMYNNLTLQNITIENGNRTSFDIHGYDGVTLDHLTAKGNVYGNGISLTGCSNGTVTNCTTDLNAWGGIAVYCSKATYLNTASSYITIDFAQNSIGEFIYIEDEFGLVNTNITVSNWTYGINNKYSATGNFTAYIDKAKTDALNFGAGLNLKFSNMLSYCWDPTITTHFVGPGMAIQRAIDKALANYTVEVAAGTYEEQVTVDNKSITLIGAGAATTLIHAPVSMGVSFTTPTPTPTPYDAYAVVGAINSTNLVMSGFTIDGLGRGINNYKMMGVAFRNSGGEVSDCEILNIENTPFSGAQHGVGVYAYNDDDTSRDITISNNKIENFQKNAMALSAGSSTPMVIDVSGNTIIGHGATTVTAQNGIQTYGALITGTVSGNTISGIAYDNTLAATKWVATSILNYYSNINITSNTITGAHMGIYNYDASGVISGNDLTIEKVGVFAFGIIGTDPPKAVPQPYDEVSEATEKSGSMISSVPLNIVINDNTVVFVGTDNTATYGIEVDAGWGPKDLLVSGTGNTVSNFEVGFEIYKCESNCDVGVFTGVSFNNNRILDNSIGIRSNVDYLTVDATCNWYGTADYNQIFPLIIGDVTFVSYLTTDDIVNPSCDGVVPPVKNITQNLYYYSIQEAIDATTTVDDDVIEASVGTYDESLNIDKAITLNGANQGVSCSGSRGAESVINSTATAITVTVNGVTIDGFTINAVAGITDAGQEGLVVSNNIINAGATGITVSGLTTTASESLTIQDNCIAIAAQVAQIVQTVGIYLNDIQGTTAATINGNNISGSYFGYMIMGLNTAAKSDITGGSITGVMQGVSVYNFGPTLAASASSDFSISNLSISGFTGDHPLLSFGNNFHAGVYVYSGGSDPQAKITLLVDGVIVDGTGKIQQDCAGLSFADFSEGTGVRQDITVSNCLILNNLNRGINIRGTNAKVDVLKSKIEGNGADAFGVGGNDGFGIVVFHGAEATVENNYITNPATSETDVTALYTFTHENESGTMEAHYNSLNNSGNSAGLLAANSGGTLNATCNWWGSTGPIPPLVSTNVTWKPFLDGGGSNEINWFDPTGSCVYCMDMTLTQVHVDIDCFGDTDGSIDLTLTGGVAPFVYNWTSDVGAVTTAQLGVDDGDLVSLAAGTYTVVVTDGNLCEQTIEVIVVVLDVTPPEMTVPVDVTVSQRDDKGPYATGYATATDYCNHVSITFSDNMDGMNACNVAGVIVRTWTAIDLAGNDVSAEQRITVEDTEAPVVIVPDNITVETDAGTCNAVVNYDEPTATDFAYFQGFEHTGWIPGDGPDWNEYNSIVTQVATGTDGIASSSGNSHAVINSDGLVIGGGSASNESGAYSRLGGYSTLFGNGFVSSVDVYLDLTDANITAGTYGFDLSTAANKQINEHKRDFIFNVLGESGKILVGASNGSAHGLGATLSDPYEVTQSGWYKFEWVFKDAGDGSLAVELILRDAAGNQLWSETLNNTSDIISTDVGGNRYMWFVYVSTEKQLAIDNTSLVRTLEVTPPSLSGTGFAIGITTISATATDACGTSTTESFTIKVKDVTHPVITTCATAQTSIVTAGCTAPVPDFTQSVEATDNCSVDNITQNPVAGTMVDFSTSPVTVTITVKDASGNKTSCTTTFTVEKASISGTVMYNNGNQSPMEEVTLKLTPGNLQFTTGDDGTYSFANLCAGTYTIEVVGNTNDVGAINSTDAGAANYWGTTGGDIEYVKFLAGDVTNDLYINVTDALGIQNYFVFGTAFDRGEWSYWKKGSIIHSNTSPYVTLTNHPTAITVVVSGGNETGFDIYAMCTGDFNGSLTTDRLKSVNTGLSLTTEGNLHKAINQEFELPLKATSTMEVGAVSMILSIPANLIEVQDVKINGSNIDATWTVKGDELRIGWNSVTPVYVYENESLVTLNLKTKDAFTFGKSLDIDLVHNPLNELADANFSVINGASLKAAKIGNGLVNINKELESNGLTFSNYPNPFGNHTTLVYNLPEEGKVNINVYNELGQLVNTLVDANQSAGQHLIQNYGKDLLPGIYIAKLRLTNQNTYLVGTIKLNVIK